MTINLTDNEADVLKDYLTRKTMRLEECGLKDSRCYLAMMSILFKIYKEEDNKYDTREKSSK